MNGNHLEPWELVNLPEIPEENAFDKMVRMVTGAPPVPIVDYPRIVACVNAMAGVKNPQRLQGVLDICRALGNEPRVDSVPGLLAALHVNLKELYGES